MASLLKNGYEWLDFGVIDEFVKQQTRRKKKEICVCPSVSTKRKYAEAT